MLGLGFIYGVIFGFVKVEVVDITCWYDVWCIKVVYPVIK